MRNTSDIVRFAKDLKHTLKTNDPYEIADYYGIAVILAEHVPEGFTAHTVRIEGYPTIISINSRYSDRSRRILCAHELGHALLHGDGVNNFAITDKSIFTNLEYEANLFALAFLTDSNWRKSLNVPIERMNNYLLKTIIDYNLEFS